MRGFPFLILLFVFAKASFAQTSPPVLIKPEGPIYLVCDSSNITLDAGPTGPYLWSTGDTTRQIKVYESRTYAVQTNGSFNPATDTIKVIFKNPRLNYANNWYFGKGAGLTFNGDSVPDVKTNPKKINFTGGSAVISGNEGNLLLYTDGKNVYNQYDSILVQGINGDTTAPQNSIIVPNPGSIKIYNVFTVKNNNLYQSTIYLDEKDSLGNVKVKNKLIHQGVDNKITAVSSADQGMWVIVHVKDKNQFISYKLSRNPSFDPQLADSVFSTAGRNVISQSGYLKAAPGGTSLAMANGVTEVFQFDNQTGMVTGGTIYDIPNSYGIDFSQGTGKLYVSTLDSTKIIEHRTRITTTDTIPYDTTFFVKGGSVFQIDLMPAPQDSGRSVIDTIYRSNPQNPIGIGGIQLGLDSKIYISMRDSLCMGVVWFPENKDSSDFRLRGLCLNDTMNQDLPNFPQSFLASQIGNGGSVSNACIGSDILFEASSSLEGMGLQPPVTYTFNFGDGSPTQTRTQGPIELTHNYGAGAAGPFPVLITIKEGTCPADSFPIELILNPYPNPNIPDTTVCRDVPVSLDAGNVRTDAYYRWRTGNIVIDTARVINISQPGLFSLEIGFGECARTDNFTINYQNPLVDLPEEFPICDKVGSIVLDAGPGTSFEWRDSLSNIIANTQTIKVSNTGFYSVSKTDNKGCIGRDTTHVLNQCDIFVPNVFTPNASGPLENETFRAFGLGIVKFEMRVYDRWGELIFVSNDLNTGWDGTYRGKLSPVGSYVYVIEFTSQGENQTSQTKKGDFTLLR